MSETFLRENPSSQVIYGFCNGAQWFLQNLHHGLYETPLDKFYSHLNFEETAVFLAKSWLSRKKDPARIRQLLNFSSKNEIFFQILDDGYLWQRSYGIPTKECQEELKLLNPFKSETLSDRLSQVKDEDWEELKKKMWKMVNNYEFRINYYKVLTERCGNKRGLVKMDFLDVYPSKKTNSPRFAEEISKMFSKYPKEFYR